MPYYPNTIDTVGELIAALQDYEPHTPIRWAAQPAWPFEYTIGTIVATLDDADSGNDRTDEPVVWFGEGQQVGYLPDTARDALGWSR